MTSRKANPRRDGILSFRCFLHMNNRHEVLRSPKCNGKGISGWTFCSKGKKKSLWIHQWSHRERCGQCITYLQVFSEKRSLSSGRYMSRGTCGLEARERTPSSSAQTTRSQLDWSWHELPLTTAVRTVVLADAHVVSKIDIHFSVPRYTKVHLGLHSLPCSQ